MIFRTLRSTLLIIPKTEMFPPRGPTLEDKNTINQLLSNTGTDKPSSGPVMAAGIQQATSDTKNSFISLEKIHPFTCHPGQFQG